MHSGGIFEVDAKRKELERIDFQLTQPDVFGDPDAVRKIQKERARLAGAVESAGSLGTLMEDSQTLLELAREGEDVAADLQSSIEQLERESESLELATLLTGDHDGGDAIIEIHPGAGGTESQDWAEMLFRMYTRWADRKGFKVEILGLQGGDEAGIKSATISVCGPNAYGYLRVERGVHRLVRISPFDAQARRHTSFASVIVFPEIDDDVDIEIEDKELRIDTYRASGAGGQHVNKTDSAVRITHLPTGLVSACQNERSQHRNREVAMKVLKAKLYEKAREEQEAALAAEVGEKRSNEWGSQIRSYVLAPYRMVKDHRTQHEVGDADKVLDGDLDGFIRAALASDRETDPETVS